jgi:hypothetical protein
MTLDKAHELIAMHVSFGSGYNRHASRMILGEVMRDFGQTTVDQLIRDYDLTEKWDFKEGVFYETPFKK